MAFGFWLVRTAQQLQTALPSLHHILPFANDQLPSVAHRLTLTEEIIFHASFLLAMKLEDPAVIQTVEVSHLALAASPF